MSNKYVFKLRRGTRYVDENGATLLKADGTAVRDDWAEYTAKDGHVNPLDGELVIEYEVVNGDGKKTPRLKIGDGVSEFKDLEYISVDSFIMPKTASVHIDPSQWKRAEDGDDRYYQVVTVQNAIVTENSKIDLNPSSDDLAVFHQKDLTFVAENWDGQIRVYCIGQVPQNAYNIPCTVTEVVFDA